MSNKNKAISIVKTLNKRIGIIAAINLIILLFYGSFEIINSAHYLPIIITTIIILAINAGLIIFYDTCIFKLCKKYHIYKY